MSQEKIDRNLALYNDYKTGDYTHIKLGEKYNLHPARINTLLMDYRNKEKKGLEPFNILKNKNERSEKSK